MNAARPAVACPRGGEIGGWPLWLSDRRQPMGIARWGNVVDADALDHTVGARRGDSVSTNTRISGRGRSAAALCENNWGIERLADRDQPPERVRGDVDHGLP
jgi:hypothetical protein